MLKRITLTEQLKEHADSVATMRRNDAKKNRRSQTDIGQVSSDEMALKSDIQGARGQLAASLITGIPWTPRLGTFDKANLGDRYKVRTVDRFSKKLRIAEDDNLDLIYILVVSTDLTTFHMVGWTYGRDCVDVQFRPMEGKPVRFIPRSRLNAWETLPLPVKRKPLVGDGCLIDEEQKAG